MAPAVNYPKVLFVSRIPVPPLRTCVASIWYCECEPRPLTLERVLPSGSAQLIVNLKEDRTRLYGEGGVTVAPGTVLAGVSTRFSIIDTAEQEGVAGVSFRPGGLRALFPLPAYETCDADIPIECLWGRQRTSEMRERLLASSTPAEKLDVLEAALLAAWNATVPHPAVTFALHAFARQTTSVAAAADLAGLSAKRFIEHFKVAVGVTPKQYCRILRFQSALQRAESGHRVDWTRVSLDSGYYDQSHLIHDFRSFAGITPTAYESDRTEFRNHVKFLQSDSAAAVR